MNCRQKKLGNYAGFISEDGCLDGTSKGEPAVDREDKINKK
jgi:hypothetical protein